MPPRFSDWRFFERGQSFSPTSVTVVRLRSRTCRLFSRRVPSGPRPSPAVTPKGQLLQLLEAASSFSPASVTFVSPSSSGEVIECGQFFQPRVRRVCEARLSEVRFLSVASSFAVCHRAAQLERGVFKCDAEAP